MHVDCCLHSWCPSCASTCRGTGGGTGASLVCPGGGGSGAVGWVCCMGPVREMAMLLVKRGNTYTSSLVIHAILEKE